MLKRSTRKSTNTRTLGIFCVPGANTAKTDALSSSCQSARRGTSSPERTRSATRKSASLAMPAPCRASCRMHSRLSLREGAADVDLLLTPPSAVLKPQRGAPRRCEDDAANAARGPPGLPARRNRLDVQRTGAGSTGLTSAIYCAPSGSESLERDQAHRQTSICSAEIRHAPGPAQGHVHGARRGSAAGRTRSAPAPGAGCRDTGCM